MRGAYRLRSVSEAALIQRAEELLAAQYPVYFKAVESERVIAHVDEAARLEGHPDNAAASLLGCSADEALGKPGHQIPDTEDGRRQRLRRRLGIGSRRLQFRRSLLP